ncbi:unnamed protein product [Chrysodeixis includens]|uniref:Uncharacterized protein n=1 Tax=Chrysodeixis includens TaxID=689277 RepID=A0A9P0C3B3_CHRIL|nr:unnamed protein product [Chrysodeixis includens]
MFAIFRCGIHNFHFNTTNHRDSVCQKAIDAVLASSVKIRRAGAHPWFWTIIEDEMFKRGKYTAVDYWIRDIKVEYSVPCKDCEDYYLKDYQAIEDRKGLQKIGYRVVLIPVHYADYCMIEMCGHEVFRCNIKQLKFNTCSEEDPVCARAIDAVIRSSAKFRQARAYFFAWNLIEQAIFQRSKHAPKDFWLTEEDVSSHLTSPEPVNCCDLDAEMKTLFESRPIIGFDF